MSGKLKPQPVPSDQELFETAFKVYIGDLEEPIKDIASFSLQISTASRITLEIKKNDESTITEIEGKTPFKVQAGNFFVSGRGMETINANVKFSFDGSDYGGMMVSIPCKTVTVIASESGDGHSYSISFVSPMIPRKFKARNIGV